MECKHVVQLHTMNCEKSEAFYSGIKECTIFKFFKINEHIFFGCKEIKRQKCLRSYGTSLMCTNIGVLWVLPICCTTAIKHFSYKCLCNPDNETQTCLFVQFHLYPEHKFTNLLTDWMVVVFFWILVIKRGLSH